MNKWSKVLLKGLTAAVVAVSGAVAQTTIFSEDFEGTNKFTFANGSQTNKWYVGTATKYGGTKSAYISFNNGTYTYTKTSASVVHMYRDVTFPASSSLSLTFNWKGEGEYYDYLSVYLRDTSDTPEAGTALSGLDLGTYRGQSTWQSATISIPASNSGTTKRLVFSWRNDASGGSDQPAAVDNIVLKASPLMPTSPYTVTQSGAAFTVTSGGSIQNIQAAIDNIKTRAQGEDCSITFGNGTDYLDIDSGWITFDGGAAGTDWGNITLSGKVTSSRSYLNANTNLGTIYLTNGVSVESAADIQNTASGRGSAIVNISAKSLTISGGTISATGVMCTAIYAQNAASRVIITGGEVSTIGGTAIRAEGASSIITINNSVISAATGTAIVAAGQNATVTIDNSTVSATSGTSVNITGASVTVTFNGGAVTKTDGTGAAINAAGANSRIAVTGGTVTASPDGSAINTASASSEAVTISGGTVSATTASAILASNASAIVTVSGGSVINSGTTDATPTIYMSHSTPTAAGSNVVISGGASVQNTASSGGHAIRTFGSVSVSGNAYVSATNGSAITLEGARTSLTVSGGLVVTSDGKAVSAIGSRVMVIVSGGAVSAGGGTAVNAGGPNGVVYVDGGEIVAGGTRIGTSGSNVIAIERSASVNSYVSGTSTDLTVSPSGASAVWAIDGGKNGISYERGANNTGFLEVSGVAVTVPRTNVSASITFANGSAAYTGAQHTHENAAISGITAGTAPTWTYTYAAGDAATGNESFGTSGKPVNAGNYSVTVAYEDSRNEGTKTAAYTVTKANPTVYWPTGLTVQAGQTLSAISLASYTNTNGTAGAFSWTTPDSPVGAAGSRSHSVTFIPTDGGNYASPSQNVMVVVTSGSSGSGGDDDEPETYTIKFDANGGAVSPASRKTNANGKVSLPTPEREGYTFDSWYTAKTGGNKVTGSTVFDDDATIYARWTINSYKVTFSAGANGAVTATVGDNVIKTGAEVEYGKSVVFTAEPAKGYQVTDWKLGNKTVSGNKTKTYTLNNVTEAATVTVSFGKTDAILTPDRVIPNAKPDEEATVVAPISQLTGEFTAGPNPVGRELGAVGFFRQGKRIANAELRIYDAVGNVVSKVKIVDKALGSQARRQVGSWDLTDVKGKPVSEGTYLVRGVVKTSDGKKEKISVILGVR